MSLCTKNLEILEIDIETKFFGRFWGGMFALMFGTAE